MKRAHPLTFTAPNDKARVQPPSGAALSATYRLQFAEIERAEIMGAERLERYRQALAPILDAMDARRTLDGETDALMNEAERIIANAAREYLIREGESRIRGRSKGGKSRPKPAWHADTESHARKLLASGRERHELVSLCARKSGRSDDAVRRVLQAAGLIDRRERAAPT